MEHVVIKYIDFYENLIYKFAIREISVINIVIVYIYTVKPR